MKIPFNFDVVGKDAPSFEKGDAYDKNPGIEPYEKAIPETAGEGASNDVNQFSMNKGQPFKTKGSGY